MKDPTNKLYKAIVDERTNGVYFYPTSSSKTPIAFDKKRHIIVYGDEPLAGVSVATSKTAATKYYQQEMSPSDSPSSCSDNNGDDDSFKVDEERKKGKVRQRKGAQTKTQPIVASINTTLSRTKKSKKGSQTSDSDKIDGEMDDDYDEVSSSSSPQSNNSPNGEENSKSNHSKTTVRFCSIPEKKKTAPLYPPDWRTMSAIDY